MTKTCAERGARLCRAAEDAYAQYKESHPEAPELVYVIGSEVPVPGGDFNAGVKDPTGALPDGMLKNDVHFIWNYAGNCITNQHGGINAVHETLTDESKDLFILTWDTVMTDSAKYADILLPDAMRSEQLNMQTPV